MTVAAVVSLDLLFVLVVAAKYKGWFKSEAKEELPVAKQSELITDN